MPDPAPNDAPVEAEPDVTDAETSRSEMSREEMEELIQELRAEVARLKVQQSRADATSWLQRNAGTALALGSVLGAAAGYGLSKALRPTPPPLSERARKEIQRLLNQTLDTASETGRSVGERASRAGAAAREQAQSTGRRLAQEAETLRDVTRTQADAWRRQAAEELDRAEKAVEEQAREASERAREAADTVRTSVEANKTSIGTTVGSVLLLAAGSYLASKARDWM
jgi:ElaB/YqjD/DUF883 family membrane-anchored ribosome-binding protein